MDFFKKLGDALLPKPRQNERYFIFRVKCKRCGEIIEGRVDTMNELTTEYESGGNHFYTRKVLMGSGENHCYQRIEVGLKFGSNRRLADKTISGGEFVED